MALIEGLISPSVRPTMLKYLMFQPAINMSWEPCNACALNSIWIPTSLPLECLSDYATYSGTRGFSLCVSFCEGEVACSPLNSSLYSKSGKLTQRYLWKGSMKTSPEHSRWGRSATSLRNQKLESTCPAYLRIMFCHAEALDPLHGHAGLSRRFRGS